MNPCDLTSVNLLPVSILVNPIQSIHVPPVVKFPTSRWFSTLVKRSLPYSSLVMFYDTSISDPIERHHDSLHPIQRSSEELYVNPFLLGAHLRPTVGYHNAVPIFGSVICEFRLLISVANSEL